MCFFSPDWCPSGVSTPHGGIPMKIEHYHIPYLPYQPFLIDSYSSEWLFQSILFHQYFLLLPHEINTTHQFIHPLSHFISRILISSFLEPSTCSQKSSLNLLLWSSLWKDGETIVSQFQHSIHSIDSDLDSHYKIHQKFFQLEPSGIAQRGHCFSKFTTLSPDQTFLQNHAPAISACQSLDKHPLIDSQQNASEFSNFRTIWICSKSLIRLSSAPVSH